MNKRKRQRESGSRDVKFLQYLQHFQKDNLPFDVVKSGSQARLAFFFP
jgi:hypothetical protein